MFPAQTDVLRSARIAPSREGLTIPWCRLPMMTLSPTPNGRASAYPPRRSGSSRRVAVFLARLTRGVTGCTQNISGWPIRIRVISRTASDTAADGHAGIAPVAQYLPNPYGLYDIRGNIWQWNSDLYRADYYTQLTAAGKVARNPQGPDTSLGPSEPGVQKRVQRGGSFLCTSQYCSRYIVGTRGKGEESSATNHIGFRCVRNPAATLPATARKCPNNRRALLLRAGK
jgi:Sulfatase-modifying factor enzyme 1